MNGSAMRCIAMQWFDELQRIPDDHKRPKGAGAAVKEGKHATSSSDVGGHQCGNRLFTAQKGMLNSGAAKPVAGHANPATVTDHRGIGAGGIDNAGIAPAMRSHGARGAYCLATCILPGRQQRIGNIICLIFKVIDTPLRTGLHRQRRRMVVMRSLDGAPSLAASATIA